MDDWILRFTNLKPKFYKKLGSSMKEVLDISDMQTYMPAMSLFFHIHNTRNSHKCITFDNRYIIKELKEEMKKDDDEDYKITSNGSYKAVVWDSKNNKDLNMEVFCKICPILDSVSYMQGNYNVRQHRNHLLPSNYNHNTFNKINCLDNSAYIDAFFCYIGSYLREKHFLPCFPLFYGTFNGIAGEFFYDISEEYYSLKNEEWFEENLGHLFSLDVGVSKDSDSESDGEGGDEEREVPTSQIEELPDSEEEIIRQLKIENHYKGYYAKQDADIKKFKKDEGLKIPNGIDYDKISGLTEEVKKKLRLIKPETFGQALRIDGMTPAAINLLLAHTKRYKFKHSA